MKNVIMNSSACVECDFQDSQGKAKRANAGEDGKILRGQWLSCHLETCFCALHIPQWSKENGR